MVKVVIEDLPDEAPVLTAMQFSATLCEDAVGGEIVELVSLLHSGEVYRFTECVSSGTEQL